MSTLTLSPQALFETGYEKLVGTPASQFRFTPGVTPLSSGREVGVMCVLYLVVIFGGQHLMRSRKPIQLSLLFQVHNAFLTLLSLGLFVLFAQNLAPIIYNSTMKDSICAASNFTQPLELLYYVNYLTKYYELLDTCFLVLRKKNLEFLHWYHHSMTALLCYTQLTGRTTVSWVPIVLNLGVHVVMYYYYFLATFNIKVWWKKYITVMQITQFVIDLAVIYYCLFIILGVRQFDMLSNTSDCQGSLGAAFFGAGLLSSYLLLFIQFFFKVYTKPSDKPKSQ
ncbi:Fatty acyl-CoA elongase/Polyunsaturated fatty acid specific elongation enzyme [Entomophthora muscae]|nr:Fatty acyl-CoA elongase/Polyunsaturated fatty acid specific elongation enzyme [Entomophthora muscae]